VRVVSLALALLVATCSLAWAGPKEDAYAVLVKWGQAIDAGDGAAVAALYLPEATLWGTVAPVLRTTPDEIHKYFVPVAAGGFKVHLGDHTSVVLSDDAVVDAGLYDFSRVKDGQSTTLYARYSFVLVKRANGWMIAHHQSSLLPKPAQ